MKVLYKQGYYRITTISSVKVNIVVHDGVNTWNENIRFDEECDPVHIYQAKVGAERRIWKKAEEICKNRIDAGI